MAADHDRAMSDDTVDSLEPILTPKELAERWKVSVKTVHRRISAGTLFAFGENLRTARIPLSAIKDFEARRCPRSGIRNSGLKSVDSAKAENPPLFASHGTIEPTDRPDAYRLLRRILSERKRSKSKRL